MAKNKKAVRRMKITGETYQQALQVIRDGGLMDPTRPPPQEPQGGANG